MRTKNLWGRLCGAIAAASVGFALACGAPAHGADEKSKPNEPNAERGRVWGYDALFLVANPLIQRELKMTTGQRAAAADATDRYLTAVRELLPQFAEAAKLASEQRAKRVGELEDKRREGLAAEGEAALEILTDPQRVRLAQVAFQLRGAHVFDSPEIRRLLEIDRGQLEQIAAARSDIIQEARRLQQEPGPDGKPKGMRAVPVRRLLAEARLRAVEALTDEQRALFDAMQGEPMSFSRDELQLQIRQRRK